MTFFMFWTRIERSSVVRDSVVVVEKQCCCCMCNNKMIRHSQANKDCVDLYQRQSGEVKAVRFCEETVLLLWRNSVVVVVCVTTR